MSELSFWIACIFEGITFGCIYGLFGLGIVLLFRANKFFNFAQTQIVAFLMILLVLMVEHIPLPIVIFIIGPLFGFASGFILHFGLMRFITERRTGLESGQMIVTFGLLLMFGNLSSFVLGDLPRKFPSLFKGGSVSYLGVSFSYDSIGIIVVSTVVMAATMIFFSKTQMGLKMEAIAENMTAARLRGIRASNVLALAWGLTGLLGIIGGILIAPKVFVSPQMLTHVLVYSLIAVVIGGLESPSGAIIGGLAIGVLENLAANLEFVGSELKFAVVFCFMVLCLITKPFGLFGKPDFRRV